MATEQSKQQQRKVSEINLHIIIVMFYKGTITLSSTSLIIFFFVKRKENTRV